MSDNPESSAVVPPAYSPGVGEEIGVTTHLQQAPVVASQAEAGAPPLEQGMADILAGVRELRDLFEAKIHYDKTKDVLLQQVGDDARAAREGLSVRALRPHFLRLIELYDDMGKLLDAPGEADAGERVANLRSALKSYRGMVEHILSELGVERFDSQRGDFERGRQQQMRTLQTTDRSLDMQVSRRLRSGFIYSDPTLPGGPIVIRPEWVEVYKYEPTPGASD